MLAPLMCSSSSSSSSLFFNLNKYGKSIFIFGTQIRITWKLPASRQRREQCGGCRTGRASSWGWAASAASSAWSPGAPGAGWVGAYVAYVHCHLEPVGGEDLLEGGVANVRCHSNHQLVQVEAGGEQEDEEVVRAGAGDGQLQIGDPTSKKRHHWLPILLILLILLNGLDGMKISVSTSCINMSTALWWC